MMMAATAETAMSASNTSLMHPAASAGHASSHPQIASSMSAAGCRAPGLAQHNVSHSILASAQLNIDIGERCDLSIQQA